MRLYNRPRQSPGRFRVWAWQRTQINRNSPFTTDRFQAGTPLHRDRGRSIDRSVSDVRGVNIGGDAPMPTVSRRRAKRVKNRLAKHGVAFLRWEQNDPQLVTMRAITETRCNQRFAKACVFPREWLKRAGGRVIADSILAEYARAMTFVRP